MKEKPLVTISIPLFKCEEFLGKCLDSVLAQTYQNLEVTLINDQTPDKSVEIAEKFIEKHQLKNWKIYHLEKNSGLSVVRNKGIDTANGKYLFFLDSDDVIMPYCIEHMVDLAEKENVQMVLGEVEAVRLPTGERFEVFPIFEKKNVLRTNEEVFVSYLTDKYPVSSWNKLIRLDLLKENKLYFTKGLFAQDVLHSFELAFYQSSIAFLREKTYEYYLHEKSVIHNRNQRHFDNWATIVDKMYLQLKKCKKYQIPYVKSYIINYKTMTLVMNWKAKAEDKWWLYSYNLYQKTKNLSLLDFFSKKYSIGTKKKSIKLSLPAKLALKIFKKQYYS